MTADRLQPLTVQLEAAMTDKGEVMTEPTYMDNPPACGTDPNWRWGFLACGCHNDGYGNHVR